MGSFSFTQALEHAAMLATQALPEALHERISAAVILVRDGHCLQLDDGHWTVASATTPDKRYSVNGSCSCEDAYYRAPEGKCKHKLAQLLARKVKSLMTVAQTGDPEPTPDHGDCHNLKTSESEVFTSGSKNSPLPESPASVNVRLMISGREVQWTLRDHDEVRLATRLERLLAQYPREQTVPQSGPTVLGQDGFCQTHQVAMKWNKGKDGRQGWHSHRLGSGDYCTGKPGRHTK